jgi:hypothetical protein
VTRRDLIEFVSGGVALYYAQRLYWWVVAWSVNRKFYREFRAAEERMRGCPHAETAVIDTGMGLDGYSRKCRARWVIRIGDGPWTPNTASVVVLRRRRPPALRAALGPGPARRVWTLRPVARRL